MSQLEVDCFLLKVAGVVVGFILRPQSSKGEAQQFCESFYKHFLYGNNAIRFTGNSISFETPGLDTFSFASKKNDAYALWDIVHGDILRGDKGPPLNFRKIKPLGNGVLLVLRYMKDEKCEEIKLERL